MHKPWVALVTLLLLPAVLAQPEGTVREGPQISVLVHHPNDGVDTLGFPFKGDLDAFLVRHGSETLFADGVAFPGFVTDGTFQFEGLADGADALEATVAQYNEAVNFRLVLETPLSLRIATTGNDRFWNASVAVGSSTVLSDVDLRLWTAIVEDSVYSRPPVGLTNGVFWHPFTVRSIQDHGSVTPMPGTPEVLRVPLLLEEDWDPEQTRIVAWIEQGGQDSPRFDAGEVVQATNHPINSTLATVQLDRGVLVEAYSATWCEPCLIGDLAVEEVAARHGLQSHREPLDSGPLYYRPPAQAFVFVAAIALGFALAFTKLPGGRQ